MVAMAFKENISAKQSKQLQRELMMSTLRSLLDEEHLDLRGHHLYLNGKRLVYLAAHLQWHPLPQEQDAQRGMVDGWTLHLMHTDLPVFHQTRPSHAVAAWVFDFLEQLRVETRVSPLHQGMTHNLDANFERWSSGFVESGLLESQVGILLFSIVHMVRSRLSSQPLPEGVEDQIEATRMWLAPLMGKALLGLRQNRQSQEDFAQHANEIATLAAEHIDEWLEDEVSQTPTNNRAVFQLLVDSEFQIDASMPVAELGNAKSVSTELEDYHVFTRTFDEERDAATLVRSALLNEYRQELDSEFLQSGLSVRRIAQRLCQRFALPREPHYQYGEEAGRLDGRRLMQLIASPTENRVFYTRPNQPKPNAELAILVDCSGSMRQHIKSVTLFIDVLVRATQLAHIPSQVLGFTTREWNGGRAYKEWMKQGKPKHPGRLNDVRHLIFKETTDTWAQSKGQIAALLKQDLFKEGVDGEAVAWASQRLLESSATHKLLLVISDGCPMDTATQLTNGEDYLTHHLCRVIQNMSKRGITTMGVGVGLDLSALYPHHIAVEPDQDFHTQTLLNVVDRLADAATHSR
ncbi:cobaltochelatase subunit CobT [Vibrio nigripulchritudo]|nr:cobaltochelatase subunit CobT [Vibrio nigripulchritudo]BDU46560.1 cobaltochelatase subunit CobT [Vibrio nigripulchritudo]